MFFFLVQIHFLAMLEDVTFICTIQTCVNNHNAVSHVNKGSIIKRHFSTKFLNIIGKPCDLAFSSSLNGKFTTSM